MKEISRQSGSSFISDWFAVEWSRGLKWLFWLVCSEIELFMLIKGERPDCPALGGLVSWIPVIKCWQSVFQTKQLDGSAIRWAIRDICPRRKLYLYTQVWMCVYHFGLVLWLKSLQLPYNESELKTRREMSSSCVQQSSWLLPFLFLWFLTLAIRKPSEKSIISQICCRSGTMTTTGLKRALTDSGSSVRPA